MEKVRAKFACHAITDTGYGQVVVHMHAVYDLNGENADFTKVTPTGNLDMHIDKGAPASDYFKMGNVYFLDFIEVPEEKSLS